MIYSVVLIFEIFVYQQTGVTNRAFQDYSSDVIVHHSEEDYKKLVNLWFYEIIKTCKLLYKVTEVVIKFLVLLFKNIIELKTDIFVRFLKTVLNCFLMFLLEKTIIKVVIYYI